MTEIMMIPKRKYRVGTRGKNQKSSSNRSGKNSQKKDKRNAYLYNPELHIMHISPTGKRIMEHLQ